MICSLAPHWTHALASLVQAEALFEAVCEGTGQPGAGKTGMAGQRLAGPPRYQANPLQNENAIWHNHEGLSFRSRKRGSWSLQQLPWHRVACLLLKFTPQTHVFLRKLRSLHQEQMLNQLLSSHTQQTTCNVSFVNLGEQFIALIPWK